MLVIPIELWPYGSWTARRTIETIVIANDGKGTATAGNYDAALWDPSLLSVDHPRDILDILKKRKHLPHHAHLTRIERFDRKQPASQLLRVALEYIELGT